MTSSWIGIYTATRIILSFIHEVAVHSNPNGSTARISIDMAYQDATRRLEKELAGRVDI